MEIQLPRRTRLALATALAGRLVVETLAFALRESFVFDQDSLPLVTFASRAPREHDGGKPRVLAERRLSAASPAGK